MKIFHPITKYNLLEAITVIGLFNNRNINERGATDKIQKLAWY